MKEHRKTYSDEDRSQILEHYRLHGARPTMRKFGLSSDTLYRWRNAEGIETEAVGKERTEAAGVARDALRVELRNKLLERAVEMLDRMGEKQTIYIGSGATPKAVEIERPPASVCKDLALTASALIDKLRLEAGEVTGREEVRHDYSDRTDADLIAEAESILRRAAHEE